MKVPMPNLRGCSDFSVVFYKNEWDIGKSDLVQHRIQVYPSSTQFKLPICWMPMHFKTNLQDLLDKFLEHELIEPCHSPYSAPALLVPMKNGKLRFVIDYRQLNKQTIKSCWPSRKSLTLWKVVVTSLPLTCLGNFINSPWKKQLRTIKRSKQHLNHLNGCVCQWASPAVQTLLRVL